MRIIFRVSSSVSTSMRHRKEKDDQSDKHEECIIINSEWLMALMLTMIIIMMMMRIHHVTLGHGLIMTACGRADAGDKDYIVV